MGKRKQKSKKSKPKTKSKSAINQITIPIQSNTSSHRRGTKRDWSTLTEFWSKPRKPLLSTPCKRRRHNGNSPQRPDTAQSQSPIALPSDRIPFQTAPPSPTSITTSHSTTSISQKSPSNTTAGAKSSGPSPAALPTAPCSVPDPSPTSKHSKSTSSNHLHANPSPESVSNVDPKSIGTRTPTVPPTQNPTTNRPADSIDDDTAFKIDGDSESTNPNPSKSAHSTPSDRALNAESEDQSEADTESERERECTETTAPESTDSKSLESKTSESTPSDLNQQPISEIAGLETTVSPRTSPKKSINDTLHQLLDDIGLDDDDPEPQIDGVTESKSDGDPDDAVNPKPDEQSTTDSSPDAERTPIAIDDDDSKSDGLDAAQPISDTPNDSKPPTNRQTAEVQRERESADHSADTDTVESRSTAIGTTESAPNAPNVVDSDCTPIHDPDDIVVIDLTPGHDPKSISSLQLGGSPPNKTQSAVRTRPPISFLQRFETFSEKRAFPETRSPNIHELPRSDSESIDIHFDDDEKCAVSDGGGGCTIGIDPNSQNVGSPQNGHCQCPQHCECHHVSDGIAAMSMSDGRDDSKEDDGGHLNDTKYEDTLLLNNKKKAYYCPLTYCKSHIPEGRRAAVIRHRNGGGKSREMEGFCGWMSSGELHQHMVRHEKNGPNVTPSAYYRSWDRKLCRVCLCSVAVSNGVHPSCISTDWNVRNPPDVIHRFADAELEDIMSLPVRLQENVPLPLNHMYANAMEKVLCDIADHQKWSDYRKWLAMPRLCLLKEGRGGKDNKRRLKMTRTRIQMFCSGKPEDLDTLWSHTMAHSKALVEHRKRTGHRVLTKEERKIRNQQKAQSHLRDGDISGAAKMLLSKGTAALDSDTKNKLQAMHPPQEEIGDVISDDDRRCAVSVTTDTVFGVMKALKYNSGAGPSCQRPRYLRTCARTPVGYRLAVQLTRVINLALCARLPFMWGKYAASGRLIPLIKNVVPNKGTALRPVVSGDMIARICGRSVMLENKVKWREILEPEQLGISVRGTENVVHTARALINEHKLDPNFCFLSADIQNAFNTYDRKIMFQAVKTYIPEIYAFTVWRYGHHIPLFLSDGDIIYSQSGSKQGDALANLLFSVYYKYLTDKIRHKYRLFSLCFCDDHYVAGNLEEVAMFFVEIRKILSEHGSIFKMKKCHIYHHENPKWNSNHDSVRDLFGGDPELQLHSDYNMEILGGFVGDDVFVKNEFQTFTKTVDEMQKICADLPDKQSAIMILRGSMDVCRVTHLLRTTPTHLIPEELLTFDQNLKDAISQIMGRTLSNLDFEWFSLRVKNSGHGFGTATHTSQPAYIASYAEARQYIIKYANFSNIPIECIEGDSQHKDIVNRFVTRYNVPNEDVSEWRKWEDFPEQRNLFEYTNTYRRRWVWRRLKSNSQRVAYRTGCAPHAGQWKLAFPYNTSCKMSSEEYVMACHLAYSWNVYDDSERRECVDCDELIDVKGHHTLNCGKYGGWTARHDEVRDVLYQWMIRGNIDVIREKKGLLDGGGKPADLFVRSYDHCRDYAFDVTVKSPYQNGWVRHAVAKMLLAADKAERGKYEKYKLDIVGKNWIFEPLAIEATGGMARKVSLLIKHISKRVASNWNVRWQMIQERIRREISCVVIRGGVSMMLRRRWLADSWSAVRCDFE